MLALCLLLWTVGTGVGRAPDTNDGDKAIRETVSAYADAFNKGNIGALAEVWARDAEYINEDGAVTRGRDNIVRLFRRLLSNHKGAKMDLKVTNIRLLKDDVALQDGISAITSADGSVDRGRYTAVWSKDKGTWRIHSARDLPESNGEVASASASLKPLQWMVGDWQGEKGGVEVSCHWVLNQAFLMQDYTLKSGSPELSVKQFVGFDPLTGQVKSWTFDSMGGYNEALWERDGNTWTLRVAGVMPSGQTGTGVNVIRYVDDNTAMFESRDREVDGLPIPNNTIKLVRKPTAR
jgi:uncharacterized protein (TIGR02246 family)